MRELPPFDESARCRKGQYDAIQTKWHGSVHERCSLGPLYEAMPRTYLGYESSDYQKRMAEWRALAIEAPDHLERTCLRCGYRWAEALALAA